MMRPTPDVIGDQDLAKNHDRTELSPLGRSLTPIIRAERRVRDR
jgi:hypothetical protein